MGLLSSPKRVKDNIIRLSLTLKSFFLLAARRRATVASCLPTAATYYLGKAARFPFMSVTGEDSQLALQLEAARGDRGERFAALRIPLPSV